MCCNAISKIGNDLHFSDLQVSSYYIERFCN